MFHYYSKKIFSVVVLAIICFHSSIACAKPKQVHTKNHKRGLSTQYYSLLKAAEPLCKRRNCHFPLVILDQDKSINAFSDGKKVYITKGMLKFAKPEEVTIILAHEIAHNIMGHISAKQKNQILGTIVDLAAAAGGIYTGGAIGGMTGRVHSQQFEREADYVGLYLMARAGYSIDHAANFWRKMALRFPNNIRGNIMATHPGSAQRFVILDKTAQEINYKRRTHQPLYPEFIKSKRSRR